MFNATLNTTSSPKALTGVYKVGRVADHRSIYSQALVVPPAARALRLVEAAGEPLQPDVTRAGHLLAGGNRLTVLLLHGGSCVRYRDRVRIRRLRCAALSASELILQAEVNGYGSISGMCIRKTMSTVRGSN